MSFDGITKNYTDACGTWRKRKARRIDEEEDAILEATISRYREVCTANFCIGVGQSRRNMKRALEDDQQQLDAWLKKKAHLTQLLQWGQEAPLNYRNPKPYGHRSCSIKKKGPRQLLQSHYRQFYPFREICAWLTYGKPDDLRLREFSYTNWRKKFFRYQTYSEHANMKSWMCIIVPSKIDIGAACDREPCWDARKTLQHMEREFTIDIDLSDYNDVRSCCKDSAICEKCWKFVAVACKILHASFTEDFGWKHILWVFSGRRGVHCWICDADARRMDDYERKKLVKYFSLRNHSSRPINLGRKAQLHPHIDRSCRIAADYFVQICINDQNILGTAEGVRNFLSLLPDEATQRAVTRLFEGCATGRQRWERFFHAYLKDSKSLLENQSESRPHFFKEITLHYLYPRIDPDVSKQLNHLLKSPFSFHPDTQKLCTPFDPSEVDDFLVSKVPILWNFILLAEDRVECLRARRSAPVHIQLEAYDRSLRVFQEFLASFKEKQKK